MIKIHDLDSGKFYPLKVVSTQGPSVCIGSMCKQDSASSERCELVCSWLEEGMQNYRSVYGKIQLESNFFSPDYTCISFYGDPQYKDLLSITRAETDKHWVADSAVIRKILSTADPLSGLMTEYPNSFPNGITVDPDHLLIKPGCAISI